VECDLPNAANTAEVHAITRELSADRQRLAELVRGAEAV
jgi:hypothetical protein